MPETHSENSAQEVLSDIRIELPGQDLIEAHLNPGGVWSVKSIGCSALQQLISTLQVELKQGLKPQDCTCLLYTSELPTIYSV